MKKVSIMILIKYKNKIINLCSPYARMSGFIWAAPDGPMNSKSKKQGNKSRSNF